jgi:hypothetical protein
MTTENRVKTSDLDGRFSIGKNARVNRLAMLGFTPDRLKKEGRFYYLTPAQVELFTDFDRHIRETGGTAGYPHLAGNNIAPPAPPAAPETIDAIVPTLGKTVNAADIEAELPAGQLATQTPEELDTVTERTELVESGADEYTGVFEPAVPEQSQHQLAAYIDAKAQRKAAAILMAENALADEYVNNPHLLDTELRIQVEKSFQFAQIDPKELAAELIAGAKRQPQAAY